MQQQLTCPSCRYAVEPGLYGIRLECGHWTHTKCLDSANPNFDKCAACSGLVNLNIPQFLADEPDSYNGRDYVQKPLSDSIFTAISTRMSKEPFKWIADKVPLTWMIREQEYGLQRMLSAGVRFEDFVRAGYTWDDLKAFKDFGSPDRKDRAREALFALKCNAENLRDYHHLVGGMVGELGIEGRHLVELFGLHFPENSCRPLSTIGGHNDKPWVAGDLVKLGFKMRDLFGAGLTYVEQYALLKPTDSDEIALGVTDQDISELPSLTEMEKQKRNAEELARRLRNEPIAAKPVPRPTYIEFPRFEYTDRPKSVHGLRIKK